MGAKLKRVCFTCAVGWGHNAGGKDHILGHAPTPTRAARREQELARRPRSPNRGAR